MQRFERERNAGLPRIGQQSGEPVAHLLVRAREVLRTFWQSARDQHQALRANARLLRRRRGDCRRARRSARLHPPRETVRRGRARSPSCRHRERSCPPARTPTACTMSRHGAIAEMPARLQPSTSCASDQAFTVALLIASSACCREKSRISLRRLVSPLLCACARRPCPDRPAGLPRRRAGTVRRDEPSSACFPGRRPW